MKDVYVCEVITKEYSFLRKYMLKLSKGSKNRIKIAQRVKDGNKCLTVMQTSQSLIQVCIVKNLKCYT